MVNEKRNTTLKIVVLLMVFVSANVNRFINIGKLVYVLQWLPSKDNEVIKNINDGQKALGRNRRCKFQNCYVTTNYTLLSVGIEDFDVVIFNVVNIIQMALPKRRKNNQLYIYFANDSAATNRIANTYDNYFNLTWTYKLNSNIVTSHIIVTNKVDDVIGPREAMH